MDCFDSIFGSIHIILFANCYLKFYVCLPDMQGNSLFMWLELYSFYFSFFASFSLYSYLHCNEFLFIFTSLKYITRHLYAVCVLHENDLVSW